MLDCPPKHPNKTKQKQYVNLKYVYIIQILKALLFP